MNPSLSALVAALTAAEPAGCDRVALAELVAAHAQLHAWMDAFGARLAVRACELDASGAGDTPTRVMGADGRRSSRDAKAAVARGVLCDAMPDWHAALASGTVSAGHTDALAAVHASLDDAGRAELLGCVETLITSASVTPVDAFGREIRALGTILAGDQGEGRAASQRRQRSLRRWTDRQTGMVHTHLTLDPVSDADLSAALDAAIVAETLKPETEQRTFDQLRADAMLNLVTAPGAGGVQTRAVTVLIDEATLADRLHANSVCETYDGNPIPPETIRRMACDADIIPVVLNSKGVALDVGRARRVATVGQRTALRSIYRTCGHPGCEVRFADCEIHHVKPWNTRGPTDLANLLPLCSEHHHLVHEGGWKLRLAADRTITLERRDDSTSFNGTTVNVAPNGTRPTIDPEPTGAATVPSNPAPTPTPTPTPTPASVSANADPEQQRIADQVEALIARRWETVRAEHSRTRSPAA